MRHLTNVWVVLYMLGLFIQVIVYAYIIITRPVEFIVHPFFDDVRIISIVSIGIQISGFWVIMIKTRDSDPSIYGQGRPFQHKLREEDVDVASRKQTF